MSFSLRFGRADVRTLTDQRVFDGYFAVQKITVEHRSFSGGWCEPVTREVFERGDAVGVLPYDPDTDSLILIEQFRAGSLRDAQSPWMLELIAGIVDPGESDESVARREGREEAGCEFGDLVPIASYYPSAGACSEHVRLFCGRVLDAAVGQVRGLALEGEDILVHRVSRRDALALLAEDRINNGHTLVALQWFALHGERLKQTWNSDATPTP
ncbi:NUDIX domain-containing protein [Congregibacter litoralis]|uniref:ADP-ribose pyrophosphatase n=1 Tax=Congregibacter litoralis KT71 TaxID=314285 RepID=A4ADV5_9GAMM|nr:NUDIX domain-containing protein [Congregibacter litoralis]EAQ95837.1 nudix-type nucleoside diphosphatase, YffH/AdpP family [Congregibacter litoralis KT71]